MGKGGGSCSGRGGEGNELGTSSTSGELDAVFADKERARMIWCHPLARIMH